MRQDENTKAELIQVIADHIDKATGSFEEVAEMIFWIKTISVYSFNHGHVNPEDFFGQLCTAMRFVRKNKITPEVYDTLDDIVSKHLELITTSMGSGRMVDKTMEIFDTIYQQVEIL